MVGFGYDVHRMAEGESLWLGGVEIDSPVGTVAHSDGDVVLHALVDALLGALALSIFLTRTPSGEGLPHACS
jgi:2-C-methyl-D-erythritol 2,4-cyclodiphosphate synthase